LAANTTPSGVIFEIPKRQQRLDYLDHELSKADIWKEPAKLRELQSEKTRIGDILSHWDKVSSLWEDLEVLMDLAREEDDSSVETDIRQLIQELERRMNTIEKAHVLSGKDDAKSTFLELHAGAGGLEAQDWAEMLLRMYLRYAEQNGFKAHIVDILADEEAG